MMNNITPKKLIISLAAVILLPIALAGCFYIETRNVNALDYYYHFNITVRNAVTLAPVDNASIEIKDNRDQVIGKGITDSKGEASILSSRYNNSGSHSRLIIWPFSPKHPKISPSYFRISARKANASQTIKTAENDFAEIFSIDEKVQIFYKRNIVHGTVYQKAITIALPPK